MTDLLGQAKRRKAFRRWSDLFDQLEKGGTYLPSAVDLEQSILGSMMVDAQACDKVIDLIGERGLDEPIFYDERHQTIYLALTRLHARGVTPDLKLAWEELRRMLGPDCKKEDQFYLLDLTRKIVTTANVESHVRVVIDRYVERELAMRANKTLLEIAEGAESPYNLIAELDTHTSNLLTFRDVGREVRTGNDVSITVFKNLDDIDRRAKETGHSVSGVSSGLTELDALTTGFQKSDYIVIGARPSMGKSALGAFFALYAAVEANEPTLFFSLEMSAEQVMLRMMCSLSGVDMQRARKGRLSDDEWRRLKDAQTRISAAPLYLDATPAISVAEVRRRVKRQSRSIGRPMRMVVIDYLQLMSPPAGSPAYMTEMAITTANSPRLKSLAKELDLSLIVMSQLSREVEKRNDKRPMLSDLRASGSIEQDADIILFPYRGEYYGETVGPDNNPTENTMEIDMPKDRNGPTGTVYALFRKETGEIADRPLDWTDLKWKTGQEAFGF